MSRRNNRNYPGKARDGWVQGQKKGGFTRRQFGIVTAGAAVLAGLGLAGKLAYDAATYDAFAFLNRENNPVQRSIDNIKKSGGGAKEVMERFVQLGPYQARQLMDSDVYDIIRKKISRDMRRAGLPYREPKTLTKAYGVPDEERCVKPALDYCIKAMEFMAEHPELGAIKMPEFKIRAVEKGDNHSKEYGNTIFVGHSYFEVYRVETPNPRNPKDSFLSYLAVPKKGGQCYFFGENDDDLEWMAVISASEPIHFLNAPFSEILPLGVFRQVEEYAKTISPEERIKMMESFSESFSYFLGKEFCKKMKIPGSGKILEAALENIVSAHTSYSDVKGAISYTKKHGMKDTALLFVNEPGEYRKRIRAE